MTAQAHALILASGTLAPVSALTAQLFPGSEPAAIGRFACGHVVPREQLLALALGRQGSSQCQDPKIVSSLTVHCLDAPL